MMKENINMMKRMMLWSVVFMILFGVSIEAQNNYREPELYKGEIIEIVSEEDSSVHTSGGEYYRRTQILKVELLDKEKEGEIIEIINNIDEVMAYTLEVEVGDDIYVFFEYDAEGNELAAHIHEFRRDKDIYILTAVFVVLMVVVGGVKGIKSLITLGLTVAGIYYLLNGIVSGGHPIFLSIVVSFVLTIVTMFLVAGFNLKAISAIIGTFGGVIIAGLIALLVSNTSNLTGLGTTEAQMLMYSDHPVAFNIHGILFASILLGTLGAVMDVCMSIASAINEVTEANPLMSAMDLFKSGMNIGRDVMGTMVNTLILAYVGTSVFLILIFMVNDISYVDIVNMDLVATEIVRAISGTIGLICAIPLTAFVSATLEKKVLN
jgi:uncharacterized membrane protein